MHIFMQGENNKAKKRLGLTKNTVIVVEPTKRAKNNEFVFYEAGEYGGVRLKRYKKVKHLEIEVYAIVDIWNENTKKILKKLNKKK